MKKYKIILAIAFGLAPMWFMILICCFLAGMDAQFCAEYIATPLMFIFFILFWILLIYGARLRDKDPIVIERRAKRQAEQTRLKEVEEMRKKYDAIERMRKAEQWRKDHTPVKAMVVSSKSTKKTYEGFIGDTTYTIGQSVTFAVEYESGRRDTETVSINSARFKELSALLLNNT